MFEEKKYIKTILTIAGILGYNPREDTRLISSFARTIHCIANIIFLILDILYLCFNFGNMTIDIFSQLTESLVTAVQIIIKLFTMMIYKNDIKNLLIVAENFSEDDDINEELRNDIKVTYTYLTTVTKSIFVGALLAWLTYMYTGLFTDGLVFFSYVPNKFFFTYDVVKIIQLIFASGCLFVFIGFDGIFMYMCYKCVSQLKMIKYKIENIMDYKDPDMELNKCIERHTTVISFINTMKKIYEIYFLVQYLMALMSYGVQMFQFTASGINDTRMVKSIFYLLAVLIQFVGCYCILSQAMYDSLNFVSEAVYNSNWYNGNTKLARKLLNILCISQREIGLKAGGLANINLAVLTNLFRASFSILTFLNTLEQK